MVRLALLTASIPLLLALLLFPIAFSWEDRTFSLAALLSASFDPVTVATGILAILLVAWAVKRESGRGGFVALGRWMIAGAHAYLWASFAVTAFLLAGFYGVGGGQESQSAVRGREIAEGGRLRSLACRIMNDPGQMRWSSGS
ncbi:MAG TPA: hypothetical protein ENK57_02235 [Polyangiaceae bacterium]|nr:hypothetical protein [Polyangiaceae bacterium]